MTENRIGKNDDGNAAKELRIGVYTCRWGVNIGAVVDIDAVRDYAETLPNVVVAKANNFTCSDPGQLQIKNDIIEYRLNRVVVAACTPKIHEETYRAVLKGAGLSPYYFEMVNLREHDSFVHQKDKAAATAKAKDLVRAGVMRARLLEDIPIKRIDVEKAALIVGAGIAGMNAALQLANQGIKVYLVEKEPTIGGKMAQLDRVFPTDDCGIWVLAPIMVSAAKHPNVKLFSYSQVDEVSGVTGNFSVTIREKARYVDPSKCTGCELCVSKCNVDVPSEFNRYIGTRKAIYVPFPQAVPKITLIDKDHCIQCKACSKACQAGAIDYDQKDKLSTVNVGAIIIATGWDEFPLAEHPLYGYGKYPDVITQIELERMLSPVGPTGGHPYRPSDGKLPKKFVMIQCVGSRDLKTNEWCSGVCCMVAMKNAQILKQEFPDAEVTVLYMDIRATDKGNEEYYRRIRNSGVIFLHGRPADVKRDAKTGKLLVMYENTNTDEIFAEPADLVVLSTGIIPSKGTDQITGVLGLERGPGGFLKEIHGCLKPQYTKQAGVYICGCASGPKNIPYSVSSALAAAGNAASLINAGRFELELITPVVNEVKCVGCHRCERSCAFGAIEVNEHGTAVVDETACKGCGVCVSSCPARAIELRYYRKRQMEDQIEGTMREIIMVPGQIARPPSKEAGS